MKSLFPYPRAVLVFVAFFAAAAAILAAESEHPLATSGDQPIRILKAAPPAYPFNMSRAGLNGNVVVEFIVDQQGKVINPVVIESNNPWFERPAIDALLKWKFQPGRKDGRAVNCRAQQLLQFERNEGGTDLWRPEKAKDHDKLPLEIRWDVAPLPIMSTYPVYPAEALQAGRKGRATVRFLVNPQGHIQAAKVAEASAPEFAGAALAAVDVWRFKPATRAGQPCSALIGMIYEFKPAGDLSVPISPGMQDVVDELRRKNPHIYPLNNLDRMPKPLSRRPPVYPSTLREAGRPGEALIEFYIDEKGDAQLPRVVSASVPEFGYAAAQAVATWRFEPPMKNGKPVIARAEIPVAFKLPPEVKAKDQPATEEKLP